MSEIRISAVTSNSEEMGLTGDANELRFYALPKDIAVPPSINCCRVKRQRVPAFE